MKFLSYSKVQSTDMQVKVFDKQRCPLFNSFRYGGFLVINDKGKSFKLEI